MHGNTKRPGSDLLVVVANEKCAGLLGEKFRGLSKGLLPARTTRQTGEGEIKMGKEDVT